MYDLIEHFSMILFIVGILAAVLLAFISTWITRYKKRKLSKKTFTKFIYLIGISSVISGIGFTILNILGSLPEISFFRVFLTGLFCVGIIPIVMVGVYIFDMKHYGYVASDQQRR